MVIDNKLMGAQHFHSVDIQLSYILGLVSTFQIITIGGVTVFSLLLIPFVLILCIKIKKIKIYSTWFILFYLSLFLSLLLEVFIIHSYHVTNQDLWVKSSINGVFIQVCLFLSFVFLIANRNRTNFFFVGLYHSCLIQMIWGYIQFVVYHLGGVSINEILFVNIFHMWNSTVQISNGQMIITGLHTNAGLLAPVLIYLFFVSNKIGVRVGALILCLITGSSTLAICGILLIMVVIFKIVSNKKISKKNVLVGISICVVCLIIVLLNNNLSDRIISIFKYLILRFQSVWSRNFTDGSTFTHTRYYTSIPFIFNHMSPINMLFGYGPKCGGLPFVIYFNQYPDIVYGTESDIISTLYEVGILGFSILYGLFIYIAKKGKRIDEKFFSFMAVIMIAGIFYSIQLNWLLIVEWTMLMAIRKKTKFNNVFITKIDNNFNLL